jgi:Heterokaryon incompatibility protein Het-C
LGEATDHFTQTEVDELDKALKNASDQSNSTSQHGIRDFVGLVGQIPGVGGGFADRARSLQAQSQAQQQQNDRARASSTQNAALQGAGIPGMSPDMNPVQLAANIYPIMVSISFENI